MKKVLITGANGFIAKNLIQALIRRNDIELLLYNRNNTIEQLHDFLAKADFVFHLAGANRPKNVSEFYETNLDLTQSIVNKLFELNNNAPLLLASSTQATNETDYGLSKLKAENAVIDFSNKNGVNTFIYRLPNVFGKWAKPNYNSVIATWCYNITHNIEVRVDDSSKSLDLVYIDDVVKCFLESLDTPQNNVGSQNVAIPIIYNKSLGNIKSLLLNFHDNRRTLVIPDVGSGFERALYATYLSYLRKDDFSYKLKGHSDPRGNFYEILKTTSSGQFSISTTKPGVTRGNHYHNTKTEKFLVVSGEARIELRNIFEKNVVTYNVSDQDVEIVEMIPGYTHNITNIGEDDLILFIWASENFDNDFPDTYIENV